MVVKGERISGRVEWNGGSLRSHCTPMLLRTAIQVTQLEVLNKDEVECVFFLVGGQILGRGNGWGLGIECWKMIGLSRQDFMAIIRTYTRIQRGAAWARDRFGRFLSLRYRGGSLLAIFVD
jgi:hypothetical protein